MKTLKEVYENSCDEVKEKLSKNHPYQELSICVNQEEFIQFFRGIL